MKSISKDELKEAIIELLKEDETFRLILKGALADSFVTKEELTSVLEEIKDLRIDFNKRMESFEKRMEEMRADFNKRMESFEKRMEAFDIKLSSLGARWGLYSEESIRNAFRGLLEEFFDAKVSRWETYDENGIVYGYPSMIEGDVVIKDNKHILIEIKSHVRKSDVAELLRISEVYEKVEGVKPELAIVTPFIDENALEFARSKKVRIYTIDKLYR
ncbi:MAG: PD-(D/E)XK nuclease family protein [Candidatus Njordarchaeales archaeon]